MTDNVTTIASRINRAAQVLGNRISMGEPMTDTRRECVQAIADLNDVAEELRASPPVEPSASLTETAKRIAWAMHGAPIVDFGFRNAEDLWSFSSEDSRGRYLAAARAVAPQPAAVTEALEAAWSLSTWASCINWRARDKDNTGEWLDELREMITRTQPLIQTALTALRSPGGDGGNTPEMVKALADWWMSDAPFDARLAGTTLVKPVAWDLSDEGKAALDRHFAAATKEG